MSKILNRPMFRGGGKVSSYGNGITTGLADGGMASKRGLVDGPGGYAGEIDRYDPKYRMYSSGKDSLGRPIYTGQSIKQGVREGQVIPQFTKDLDSVGLGAINLGKEYGYDYLKTIPDRLSNYFTGTDKPIDASIPMTMDEYQQMKNEALDDEVISILGVDTKIKNKEKSTAEKLSEQQILERSSELSKLLIDQASDEDYRIEDDVNVTEEKLKEMNDERDKESRTLSNQMYEDLGLTGKGGSGTGTGENLTDKERVEKSKKLYKELLSGDKSARIADLSDWALSLFEKSTKEGATVKSMLGEVAGEISKKPSRSENLDRDASKLAIQDLMMERKSKSDAAAFKDKTMFQLENAAAIKGRKGSFEEILEVTSKGGKRKNNSNIAAAIGLKYGSGAWTGILKAGESPPTDGIFIQENENGSKLVIRVVEGAIDVLHTVV